MEGAAEHLPYHCIVDEGDNHCWHFYKTQPTNRYLKAKEEEEEVWRRKRKRHRQTGQQADRVSGTRKERRWHRQQNERVIEVSRRERKGGATWEKSNMGSVQQRYVGKRACYGSPLGLPRQIVCAVSQSVLRSTQPHMGTCEGVKMGLLKTDETRCFLMPSRADKSLISCFACDTKGAV